MNPIGNRPDVDALAERFRVADRIAHLYGLKRRFPHRRGAVTRPKDLVVMPGLTRFYAEKKRSGRGELNRRPRRPSYRPLPKVEAMNWESWAAMVQ